MVDILRSVERCTDTTINRTFLQKHENYYYMSWRIVVAVEVAVFASNPFSILKRYHGQSSSSSSIGFRVKGLGV